MKNSIFLCMALLAMTGTLKAQTTSANVSQTVTLNLQDQIDISISSATGTSFTFSSPDHYADGISSVNASSFTVKSNKSWVVTVKAATGNFSGPAGNTMPASVLGCKLDLDSDFAFLSTSEVNLTSGSRGVSNFTVDYQANPGFGYDAGTYTLNVIYTATQQ